VAPGLDGTTERLLGAGNPAPTDDGLCERRRTPVAVAFTEYSSTSVGLAPVTGMIGPRSPNVANELAAYGRSGGSPLATWSQASGVTSSPSPPPTSKWSETVAVVDVHRWRRPRVEKLIARRDERGDPFGWAVWVASVRMRRSKRYGEGATHLVSCRARRQAEHPIRLHTPQVSRRSLRRQCRRRDLEYNPRRTAVTQPADGRHANHPVLKGFRPRLHTPDNMSPLGSILQVTPPAIQRASVLVLKTRLKVTPKVENWVSRENNPRDRCVVGVTLVGGAERRGAD
jgi:hypothetical protein